MTFSAKGSWYVCKSYQNTSTKRWFQNTSLINRTVKRYWDKCVSRNRRRETPFSSSRKIMKEFTTHFAKPKRIRIMRLRFHLNSNLRIRERNITCYHVWSGKSSPTSCVWLQKQIEIKYILVCKAYPFTLLPRTGPRSFIWKATPILLVAVQHISRIFTGVKHFFQKRLSLSTLIPVSWDKSKKWVPGGKLMDYAA